MGTNLRLLNYHLFFVCQRQEYGTIGGVDWMLRKNRSDLSVYMIEQITDIVDGLTSEVFSFPRIDNMTVVIGPCVHPQVIFLRLIHFIYFCMRTQFKSLNNSNHYYESPISKLDFSPTDRRDELTLFEFRL